MSRYEFVNPEQLTDDETIWAGDPKSLQDSEWSQVSSNFTNAGYREGITAGKESALQAAFDEGYATVGVPLGRELGVLRGVASALLSFLDKAGGDQHRQELVAELRAINAQLGEIRLSDIAPPDLEAIRHAREHLDAENDEEIDPMETNEELKEKRDMEKLEDMLTQMSAGATEPLSAARPTMDDVRRLKERLRFICGSLEINPQWS
ncbi:hypothetical protein WOLCODRAFT_136699 [Wolfiporia cocos MD-104 SS10]|uniref:Protein YAE1 n=1 Tax=Wolfiporia cocos (strain MD-104) TaxID=742152 RepID=A0A2H3JJX8_WOLCO|nr:hypothetical protein WOLCODRAFT_136699 [Wolfiporia cocos MD-104 SS10]